MLTITSAVRDIRRQASQAFIEEFARHFARIANPLNNAVQILIQQYLKDTDTYRSLVDGDLRVIFGFWKGSEKRIVDDIVEIASRQVSLVFTAVVRGNGIDGGLYIHCVEADFSELIDRGVITTEKMGTLPFAEWLLVRGDDILIDGYGCHIEEGKGRSGGAIMFKSNKGRTWSIPPAFSGYPNSNWITKALRNGKFRADLEGIIRQYIT